jgi:purine-cytosine permease-like protein
MSVTNVDVGTEISRETLAGRMPIPGAARLYNGFGTLLNGAVALGAASYNYLFGASIAAIGSTSIGILGYLIGLMMTLAPMYLAAGMLSYRHGVDPVDAAKSALGTRGSSLLLFMILITTLGWGFVLVAMTGQAAGRLQQVLMNPGGAIDNTFVAIVSIVMLALVWLALRKGPAMMAVMTRFTSPAVLIIAAILLYLICRDVNLTTLWHTNVPAATAYTTDPLLQLAYGVEFGASNSLTIVPFFGGIARLIHKRKHVITPCVLGVGVIGAGFTAAVGALASVSTGSSEPAEWVVRTAGSGLGAVIVIVLLLANLGTLVSFFYLAGVSVQQIRFFARMRWDVIVRRYRRRAVYGLSAAAPPANLARALVRQDERQRLLVLGRRQLGRHRGSGAWRCVVPVIFQPHDPGSQWIFPLRRRDHAVVLAVHRCLLRSDAVGHRHQQQGWLPSPGALGSEKGCCRSLSRRMHKGLGLCQGLFICAECTVRLLKLTAPHLFVAAGSLIIASLFLTFRMGNT